MLFSLMGKLFGHHGLRSFYTNFINGSAKVTGIRSGFLFLSFTVAQRLKLLEFIKTSYIREFGHFSDDIFNKDRLDILTFNAYNLHELCNEPMTDDAKEVVVLCPAFDLNTISAGFFGVFAFSIFCAKEGYKTRLLIVDRMDYSESRFRKALSKSVGVEDLFSLVKVEYVGDRKSSIYISRNVVPVATVWYTAYLARHIADFAKGHFIYLIQDYEAAFHAHNTAWMLADNSYRLKPYYSFISTPPLFDYMNHLFNGSYVENENTVVYKNPSKKLKKILREKRSKEISVVLYSRPVVNRNMFELAALSLIHAVEKGVFPEEYEWKFYGMGIGNVSINLPNGCKLKQLPRMSLDDYYKTIQSFDIGLSLMASAHPSLVPIDLAANGTQVVTNDFKGFKRSFLERVSDNIIVCEPSIDSLIAGLDIAVGRVIQGVSATSRPINYPLSWEECWGEDHKTFLHKIMNDFQTKNNLPTHLEA